MPTMKQEAMEVLSGDRVGVVILGVRLQMPEIDQKSAIFFANQLRSPLLAALANAEAFDDTPRGRTIIVGALHLGGPVETIPRAIRVADLGIDQQAQTVLTPVTTWQELNDLPDDLWIWIRIEFYKDAADAVFEALVE